MKLNIYLDYAAATPMDDEVIKVMKPYYQTKFYNPSASYLVAKGIASDLDEARKTVAHWLGGHYQDIHFVAGASEANNLAIKGIMQTYPSCNLTISSIEHESVIEPAKKYDGRIVKVDKHGRLDLIDLAEKIDSKTVLVSVQTANNEIGTTQPIKEIARIIQEKQKQRSNNLPLYFHADATQAPNYLDLHYPRQGVDIISLNGGKIYGPKQSGALYLRPGINLTPQIIGGGQEDGLRAGTQNVASDIGFAKALDVTQLKRKAESYRMLGLREKFIELLSTKINNVKINGSDKYFLPNIIHVTIPGINSERLLYELDNIGIQAAAGPACTASYLLPSHVLLAIGLNLKEINSSLRFSLGRQTTLIDIETTVLHLIKAINKMRQISIK